MLPDVILEMEVIVEFYKEMVERLMLEIGNLIV